MTGDTPQLVPPELDVDDVLLLELDEVLLELDDDVLPLELDDDVLPLELDDDVLLLDEVLLKPDDEVLPPELDEAPELELDPPSPPELDPEAELDPPPPSPAPIGEPLHAPTPRTPAPSHESTLKRMALSSLMTLGRVCKGSERACSAGRSVPFQWQPC